MKWMHVLWALLALSLPARAAKAESADVTVKIGPNFEATAVANEDIKCYGETYAKGRVIARSQYRYDSRESFLIRQLLDGSRACSRAVDSSTPKVELVIDDKASNTSVYSPYATSPRTGTLRFEDDLWGEQTLDALGEVAEKCKGTGRKEGSSTDEQINECSVQRHGNRLQFKLPPDFRSGSIRVDFKDSSNKSRTLIVELQLCRFEAQGTLRSLVRGAARQRVELEPAADQSSCANLGQPISHLVLGTAIIPLSAAASELWRGGLAFDVRDVPDQLPLGLREFELHGSEGIIGVVSLEVLEAFKVAPRLRVDYRARGLGARNNPLSGYFDDATGTGDPGFAVVNPMTHDPANRWVLTNTAELTLPGGLPTAPEQAHTPVGRNVARTPAQEEFFEVSSIDEYYQWAVLDHPINGEVFVADCQPFFKDKPGSAKPAQDWCVLDKGPASLRFSVASPTQRPLRARLALVMVTTERGMTHKPDAVGPGGDSAPKKDSTAPEAKPEERTSTQILLEVDVTLAEQARRESVPLPIRDVIEVNCEGPAGAAKTSENRRHLDIAYHGETQAIDNEAVRTGACQIQIKPACLGKGGRNDCPQAGYLRALADLFGPQTLLVTVKREGVDEAVKVWPLRLHTNGTGQNTALVLPAPSGDDQARGLYTVHVRIAAAPNGDAIYRVATQDKLLADITTREHADLRFNAKLRPRGPMGWKVLPIRTYVTGSLAVTGFRTPASVNELRHSGQSAAVQYVTPRAGLLFSIEPFNDDEGVNPLPLDPTFQIGMNLVQFSQPDFAPTFVTGFALTVPVLEDAPSQFGSKVSGGFYFEYDPRFRSSHFMAALGLNIGSLFSGNTK